MKPTSILARILAATALSAGTAWAHCDTPAGPVIPEARAALEAGDATPILKWVKPDHEAEIQAAFAQAVAVRVQSPEAKELADRYFLETLVRIHRAGEGAPYTGIKDEPIKPIVALADQALAEGSADAMIQKMSGHLAQAIGEKFQRAVAAQAHKDDSVEAGREYVEAYVTYVHYVEGVRDAIMAAGGHAAHAAVPAESAAPAEETPENHQH